MVIDTQFFNQPDAAYYGKQLNLDALSFKVLASAEKPGIWITGPKKWPPAQAGKFPVAIVWKNSTKANIGAIPETHGHLILTHQEIGEPLLLKLSQHDKLPLPGDDERPNTRPPEEEEQFSVGELWYTVDDSLLAARPGKWVAAVISGAAISNPHEFQVLQPHPKGHPPLKKPEMTSKPLTEAEMHPFRSGKLHPSVPEEGIAFRITEAIGQEPPLLYGAFSLPASPEGDGVLHIAALVSGPEYVEMRRIPIRIPTAATRIVEGRKTGFFTLDLRSALGNPRLKSFHLPEHAYITFVSGTWIGTPALLAPTSR